MTRLGFRTCAVALGHRFGSARPNSYLRGEWTKPASPRARHLQSQETRSPLNYQCSARHAARTSRRRQDHVRELRSGGDLGYPAVMAFEGPTKGHLLGHGCG